MRYHPPSDDSHQPVMWLKGRAIYAAHFIVLVYVVSMLVTTILMAFHWETPFTWLVFDSSRVLKGEVWRLASYGLWNPPDIWFAIDMLMIVWFGREVEKFLGRRSFLWLFAGLYLICPFLFTVVEIWNPISFAGETGAFAIFVAFATLYPGAMLIFEITARWAATILVGIYTLIDLAHRDALALATLWMTVGFAFVFVRSQQGHLSLPGFSLKKRAARRATETRRPDSSPGARSASMAEVDALLDKIASSGFASLTAAERARLEAARADISRRASGRR